ncbi:ferredoxin [Streptomyces sp. NPDC059605]|uniref:ferredoxin n=1 Tax=unclassified Streptomyces TaxID=2593676 RepID=UPI0036A6BADA
MRITADTGCCVGSGMCALTAGEVFDQGEHDGKVVVLRPEPSDGERDLVREAVGLCPAGAITLADPGTPAPWPTGFPEATGFPRAGGFPG